MLKHEAFHVSVISGHFRKGVHYFNGNTLSEYCFSIDICAVCSHRLLCVSHVIGASQL